MDGSRKVNLDLTFPASQVLKNKVVLASSAMYSSNLLTKTMVSLHFMKCKCGRLNKFHLFQSTNLPQK